MKKLKTILAALALLAVLFTATGVASANEVTPQPTEDTAVTTYGILADPGNGGGGGR